jgi:hypothetical protein
VDDRKDTRPLDEVVVDDAQVESPAAQRFDQRATRNVAEVNVTSTSAVSRAEPYKIAA